MYAGKKSSLLQWEKVLKLMMSGESVTPDSLAQMPEMQDVPMYRLSSFIYHVKLAGGVVKVAKNGRKIESYQLMNVKDMEKYLESREKVFSKSNTKVTKVKKLADLQTEEVVSEIVSEVESTELVVTEVTV
jgi:hypothetical protein